MNAGINIKAKPAYNGVTKLITERRQRERYPKTQFFIVLVVVLIFSLMLFFLFNLLPRLTTEDEFQIIAPKAVEIDGRIVIDADLKMNFSNEVVEALENGIPLTIAVEVQVFQERLWWKDDIIKESLQLFELRYHPLTDVHEVKNLASNDRYSFNSRQDALDVLGTIRSAHLLDKKILEQNQSYYVQIHTLLDVSRLPSALRQVALLSPSWRLESAWHRLEIVFSETELVP
jgi:hypothetical protein